jgi:hypothetical protein
LNVEKLAARGAFVNSFFFLAYFTFWWTVKLGILPGLHGDEAWSALSKGQLSLFHSGTLTGMNNYTGILQPLISQAFLNTFGTGVMQIRIAGVLANLCGLLVIAQTLSSRRLQKSRVAFFLILGQSALYLTSPRVAWEVNSFTLFLMSLLFACLVRVHKSGGNPGTRWIMIFLITNIVGTYNHVIFSSISLSLLVGLGLWSAYHKSFEHKRIAVLLAANLVNVVLVILVMMYAIDKVPLYIQIITVAAVLSIEIHCYRKASVLPLLPVRMPRWAATSILTAAAASFLFFHGIAFFEVITGYKVLLQNYSYECPPLLAGLSLLCGGIFIVTLTRFLIEDLRQKNQSVAVFFIVAYSGILSLYTVKTSYRYYLILYLVTAIYLSLKLRNRFRQNAVFFLSLLLTFILVNSAQFKIFFTQRPLKAVNFNIGNGQSETSAHFLPKEPLIKFLVENKSSSIAYAIPDAYFLEQPILFYKRIGPWKTEPNSRAIVGYNFDTYRNGFLLYRQE